MIPAYTPESCWLKALFKKADALADLAGLQAFLGADDKAAALAGNMYLHTSGRAEESDHAATRLASWKAKLPAVEIGVPGGAQVLTVSSPATGLTVKSGIFEVLMLREVDPDKADDIAELDFQDEVGLVAEQIASSYLLDASDVVVTDFERQDDTGKGEYFELHKAMIILSWGSPGEGDR